MPVSSQIDDDHQHLAATRAATVRPSQVRKQPRSFMRENLGLLICAVGFAAGCVFWHYVGFWTVVQHVFYSGGSAERSVQSQSHPQSQTVPAVAQASAPANIGLLSVTLSADTCASLIMDRSNGSMSIQPCVTEVMPLNSLRAARKDDRRVTVAEAKAAAIAAAVVVTSPPVAPKTRAQPSAPAVASWSSTIVTSPAR
jgi:hypothetical protein